MDNAINRNPIPKSTIPLPFLLAFALLLAAMYATGCSDSSVAPEEQNQPPETFGLMEVTISGIGSGDMQAKASPIASTISRVSASGSFIQMEPVSNGSFTSGTRGAGGQRYLYATFRVRNADADGNAYGDARQNLTFMAVDTDGSASVAETFGITPISVLRLFDGTELSGSAAKNFAEATIPTGRVVHDPAASTSLRPYKSDVLQVFSEDDLNDITPPSGVSLFPYGFITRSPEVTPGSRALPASPAAGQFDGVVTFAFKLPLQASANNDPFEITGMFLPVDDSETRITQSIEEQTPEGRQLINTRASALNPNVVTILAGSSYSSSITRLMCNPVRVAGLAGNPAATLYSTCFDGGSGTAADPYEVATLEQLQLVGQYLGAHFEQTTDIDASDTKNWNGGAGFEPFGDESNPFSGSYDGGGNEISGLTIVRPSRIRAALFSNVGTGSTIKNVHLASADVEGDRRVGVLAGRNEGSITGCSAAGTLKTNNFVNGAGGLVYHNEGTITGSYAAVAVTVAVGVSLPDHAGGLVGQNRGTIKNSYATGDVSANDSAGGLVGYNYGTIETSYATGAVSSLMTASGLVGGNNGSVTQSYWDTQTTGQDEPGAGTGLSTDDMQGADNELDGFEFGSVWQVQINPDNYPTLVSQ